MSPSGQALVEFAVILPLLFFMMVIIIDFGRALYVQTALQNGSREGARFGTVHPTWVTSADHPNPDNISYRTSTEPGTTVNAVDITVTCTSPGEVTTNAATNRAGYLKCAVSGGRVQVVVTSQFTPLTPIISTIVGSNLTLTGSTRMAVE
jgi:Flp pilus assembly protein TadG